MATYMQAPGYAEMLIELNGWDIKVLEDFRAHPLVSAMPGGIDSVATLEQLREINKLIPEEWLPAAVGTPQQCAQACRGRAARVLLDCCARWPQLVSRPVRPSRAEVERSPLNITLPRSTDTYDQ